jgi:excisionase family DNA binding protein
MREQQEHEQPRQMLLRRRESATVLGVSESQLRKWEASGVLPAVRIPGLRAVRHRASDVESLANNIAAGRLCVGEGR